MTEDDALAMLRRACDAAGSIRLWAAANGFSAPYVSDVLLRRRHLGPRVLKVLGLEAVRKVDISYRKINR